MLRLLSILHLISNIQYPISNIQYLMENIVEKANFLKNELVNKFSKVPPLSQGLWGKMNMHHVVEHMSYSFRQANGKDIHTACITPGEHIPKMQAFLDSDKEFRENTPNKMLPDEPSPPVHTDIQDSLAELQQEINDFFIIFEKTPGRKILNPIFGELNYDQWVQLLYKHGWHHLRQFGITG